MSFTYDRLGRCFRFVYIYACCIAVFLCCYRYSVNKDLYNLLSGQHEIAITFRLMTALGRLSVETSAVLTARSAPENTDVDLTPTIC